MTHGSVTRPAAGGPCRSAYARRRRLLRLGLAALAALELAGIDDPSPEALEPYDGHLDVLVRDDGAADTPWVAGVGLAAMHERADEVGGSLEIVTGHDGATVHARLPLDAGASHR